MRAVIMGSNSSIDIIIITTINEVMHLVVAPSQLEPRVISTALCDTSHDQHVLCDNPMLCLEDAALYVD